MSNTNSTGWLQTSTWRVKAENLVDFSGDERISQYHLILIFFSSRKSESGLNRPSHRVSQSLCSTWFFFSCLIYALTQGLQNWSSIWYFLKKSPSNCRCFFCSRKTGTSCICSQLYRLYRLSCRYRVRVFSTSESEFLLIMVGGALIDAVLCSQVIYLLVYYFYGSAQLNSLLRELCD